MQGHDKYLGKFKPGDCTHELYGGGLVGVVDTSEWTLVDYGEDIKGAFMEVDMQQWCHQRLRKVSGVQQAGEDEAVKLCVQQNAQTATEFKLPVTLTFETTSSLPWPWEDFGYFVPFPQSQVQVLGFRVQVLGFRYRVWVFCPLSAVASAGMCASAQARPFANG